MIIQELKHEVIAMTQDLTIWDKILKSSEALLDSSLCVVNFSLNMIKQILLVFVTAYVYLLWNAQSERRQYNNITADELVN